MECKNIMNMSRSQNVTVVLVNWNGWRDTINCVESLNESYSFDGFLKIVIVDNNSSDSSLERLSGYFVGKNPTDTCSNKNFNGQFGEAKFERFDFNHERVSSVILVDAKDNFGYAGGINIGCRLSETLWNSDFFWLLNNDCLVAPDALLIMLTKMQDNLETLVCGCTVLDYDNPDRVQSYGGSWYSMRTGRGWSIGLNEIYNPHFKDTEAEDLINYVSGAAMLIRALTLNSIGYLSEDYFLYNEEIDLSLSLSSRKNLGVSVRAKVYHKVGSSIGTDKGDRIGSQLATFFQARSKLIFASKHVPHYLPLVWLTLLARSFKLFMFSHSRSSSITTLRVLLGQREADPIWFEQQSDDKCDKK